MKKWTYLVAAGMLLGAAPVFTGCIDNDEPEGITALRQAKSELLKAKVAVEEANAASILADAALKEAQAQIALAEAEYIKAQTEYQNALTLKAQYEAELANIQNQEEQARLEDLIKQLEAEQAERERKAQEAAANLELALLKVQVQLAEQQALYEKALKDLALAQNTLTTAQKAHLQEWITEVENAELAVQQAAAKYEEKATAYATALKTLDEAESDELAQRELARAVELAQRDYDKAVEARDLAKATYEKDLSSTEALETEKAELEAQLEAVEKSLADYELEKEKLAIETAEEAKKVEELKAAYEAIIGVWEGDELIENATQEYTLAEIKIENRNILGLPTYINNWGIEEQTYLYSDYLKAVIDETDADFAQKAILNYYIKDVNSWTRTANDDAWTQEDILVYTQRLNDYNALVEEYKPLWENAVAAYKGKVEIDPTEMNGYDDIAEAVDTYNKAVTAYYAAEEAYETYVEANPLSTKVYSEARTAAQETLNNTRAANEAEKNTSIEAAQAKVDQAYVTYRNAYAAWRKLNAEYQLITTPTDEQTKAVEDARVAYADAWDAYIEEIDAYNEVVSTAEDLQAKKNSVAYADYLVALYAAQEAQLKAEGNDEAISTKTVELSDAISDALATLEENYINAQSVYESYLEDHNGYISSRISVLEEAYNNSTYNEELGYYEWTPQQADAKELAEVYKYELNMYINYLSEMLFGTSDRLVELTVDEITELIENAYMETYPDAEFVPYSYIRSSYFSYGYVGRTAYFQAYIDLANATMENETAIAALKTELQGHLAAVDEQIAAAAAEATAAETAYTEAQEALDAQFADIEDKIEEAEASKYALKPIINKLTTTIETYLSYETQGLDYDASSVKELKEKLAELLQIEEDNVYDKETALLEAQKAQEEYASEQTDAVTIALEALTKAEEELTAAQEELTAANEALQAEIERISSTEE